MDIPPGDSSSDRAGNRTIKGDGRDDVRTRPLIEHGRVSSPSMTSDDSDDVLTPTTRRARARRVVGVSTSSLSSLVIDGLDTLPCSMSGLVRTSSLPSPFIVRFPALSLLLSPGGMSTPIVPGLGPLSHGMCSLC